MRRLTDDEWIAQARARAAGDGEPADSLPDESAPLPAAVRVAAPPAPALPCPYCEGHPPLEEFRRSYAVSPDPLLYCRTCYGFWAAGDSLSPGVADPDEESLALTVATAPRRCRACFGHLKPDDVCAKCGKAPAPLNCPSCKKVMDRREVKGVRLDTCTPCDGTWFDTGEIGVVFGLTPPQGWALSAVDETDPDVNPDEKSLFLQGLFIVLRALMSFL